MRRLVTASGCNYVQMKKDADECAAVIFSDFDIRPGRRDHKFCKELIWKNGGNLWFLEGLPKNLYGFCAIRQDDYSKSYIVISQDLTRHEQCAVMIHELAHRLMFSQAYEHLNKVEYAKYPREDFQELTALFIERRFLEAGGTGVCKSKDLE